jgi:hypothetical protein
MAKLQRFLKRFIIGLPIAAILGASFFPLHVMGRQLLVLFTLLWFMIFILFDVLGK